MKSPWKIIYLLTILWSVLAGYFAFLDLQISNSVINPNVGWALFLQQYGELPGLVIIIVGIFLFSQRVNYNSKVVLIIVRMFLVLGETVTVTYLIFVVLQNITGSQLYFLNHSKFITVLCLVISVSLVFPIKLFKLSYNSLTYKYSKIVVGMAFVGYVMGVQLVKIFWGRIRFRDLDALQSNFTEWFLPQGINGSESFPSGHAAMAWMLLPLIILIPQKIKIAKILVTGLITAWGIAVSLSRVVIGAHYASDVLFGSFIIIISFFVFTKKYLPGKL